MHEGGFLMAAFLIARVNILDMNKYKQYLNVSPKIIEKYGGKYIARAGETVTLEGPEETRRVVIIEFPSLQRAKEFYNSIEYQEAKNLRNDAAIGELLVVDGIQ
jgi:uncharacterized protein (DUF1330 family)